MTINYKVKACMSVSIMHFILYSNIIHKAPFAELYSFVFRSVAVGLYVLLFPLVG